MSWRRTTLSPDGTHHLLDGAPLYEARFDEVLKFHAPGLAPVRLEGAAWHIRADGAQAYVRRFARTFGFYEGLAAVSTEEGWHHITAAGEDLYGERHSWCGNYQEGRCTVRDSSGAYFHLDPRGRPAYPSRWRYAGDFRDGIAVVQDEAGYSTHVGCDGAAVHGRWFLDLDVFHKGFARARDEDGWMHVNRAGRPSNERRFAAVEPFYNGHARVERFDGALEVIDETGRPVVELRPALRDEFAALSGDLVGFWRTQTIRAAVAVGVPDAMPATAAELARRLGLIPERTARLLAALQELSLVEREGALWRTTRRGELLRRDHPRTLADAALEYGGALGGMWTGLDESLRAQGDWAPRDVFALVASEPGRVSGHHRMLRSYARHDYEAVPAALRLRGDEKVIDAGGGVGVLAELLLRHHPELRVLLLEREEVAARTEIAPELAGRLEVRTADIFEPWGHRGDAVLLSRVLHDWDDEGALLILRNARAALPEGGRLYLVELLVPEGGADGSLCSLHLLMTSGGKERTAGEYAALMCRAGFAPGDVVRLPRLQSVIEGVAR